MPSSLRSAIQALAADATTTANGPAISSHGQRCRYQGRGTLAGNDETRLFMTHDLLAVHRANDKFNFVRTRLELFRMEAVAPFVAMAWLSAFLVALAFVAFRALYGRLQTECDQPAALGVDRDRLLDADNFDAGQAPRRDREAA